MSVMLAGKLVIAITAFCFIQRIHCKDDEDDDIFSFSDKKAVPINAPSPSSSKASTGAAPNNNPFNGIQELSNQFKDGNLNNLKKISDTNAYTLMSVLGLGSNWMGTNLRLLSQWNDANRDLGEKVITQFYKMQENNLKFIKATVENTNNNIKKGALDPVSKQITEMKETFNASPADKDDSGNNLALVSKSGRPVETLAEITNELPTGLVNAGSGWFSG